MSKAATPARVGMTALILGVLLFSTVEVASKLMQTGGGVASGNPFWIASFRSFVSGLLLCFPAFSVLRRRGLKIGRHDMLVLSGIGLVGVTLMAGLFHLGITFLPANIAALLFSCNPVFVVLLASLLLDEKITIRKVTAAGLCLCGVFILSRDRGDGLSLTGIFLMAGATLAFALYTVLCKKVIPRYGALPVTAFAALAGGVVLIPVALAVEGVPFAAYGSVDWVGLLYLAVFGTAMGYFLYIYGIGHVGAGAGSMAFFLKPFAAALFAWLVLGEKFSAREVIAGILILSGMITALAPFGMKNRHNISRS